jgi:hypothetical protein
MADLLGLQALLDHLDKASTYQTWCKKNPGDAALWKKFAAAILAGGQPAPPSVKTQFGAALVQAGSIALGASTGGSAYGQAFYGGN